MQNFLDRVKTAKSIRELDKIASEYFLTPESKINNSEYSREINMAIIMREQEIFDKEYGDSTLVGSPNFGNSPNYITTRQILGLIENGTTNNFKGNKMAKPIEDTANVDNTVPFDLKKKKIKKSKKKFKPTDLSGVKCGCKIHYNVLCIHKTNFEGITPDNYISCAICGCDHKMDRRLAVEVHAKLGQTI